MARKDSSDRRQPGGHLTADNASPGHRGPGLGLLAASIALGLMSAPALAETSPDFRPDPAMQAAGNEQLDLTFDDAVQRTLSQNAAMDLSQARIAEARAAIEQASGNLLPTLDLSFGVMGSNNPLNVFGMKLQQEQA
ncbi:TolC family protein, partial [Guyparkeria sp.]